MRTVCHPATTRPCTPAIAPTFIGLPEWLVPAIRYCHPCATMRKRSTLRALSDSEVLMQTASSWHFATGPFAFWPTTWIRRCISAVDVARANAHRHYGVKGAHDCKFRG